MVAIKLGSKLALSGATAYTFRVVPQSGSYEDDQIYKRALEIEQTLAQKESGEPAKKG